VEDWVLVNGVLVDCEGRLADWLLVTLLDKVD